MHAAPAVPIPAVRSSGIPHDLTHPEFNPGLKLPGQPHAHLPPPPSATSLVSSSQIPTGRCLEPSQGSAGRRSGAVPTFLWTPAHSPWSVEEAEMVTAWDSTLRCVLLL